MKNLSHSSTWNFTSQSLRTFFPRAPRVFHLAGRSTFALSSPPGPVGGGVMGGWRGPLDFLRLRGGMLHLVTAVEVIGPCPRFPFRHQCLGEVRPAISILHLDRPRHLHRPRQKESVSCHGVMGRRLPPTDKNARSVHPTPCRRYVGIITRSDRKPW